MENLLALQITLLLTQFATPFSLQLDKTVNGQ